MFENVKTNWIPITNDSEWDDLSENDRIRFNVTEVGDDYAGWNLKIYFK